ncbi:MAG: hypothetical protein E4H10_05355 [Bacteroidia bacterium]|nr:MAG: hypothetical protein E4H10_05355 [Bacteroidia bacterium]
MRKMRKSMIATGLALAVALTGFTSCEKTGDKTSNGIEGVYIGTFSISNSLKSAPLEDMRVDHGTSVVTLMGDHQIEVHCFGEDIDSTLMLDYYEHNDSIMVCLTGDDFTNIYGHMLGEGHMSGGMMGDKNEGDSDWMHHMDDEHAAGDEHFGGFDLEEGSFTYSLKMIEGSSP